MEKKTPNGGRLQNDKKKNSHLGEEKSDKLKNLYVYFWGFQNQKHVAEKRSRGLLVGVRVCHSKKFTSKYSNED